MRGDRSRLLKIGEFIYWEGRKADRGEVVESHWSAVKIAWAAGGGAIVNIASIMGMSGGGIYPIASYHASKGGLVNLTRGLAVEWASRGIRVNAIAPTWVRTEFTKALLDDPEMSKQLLDLMPLRKFADTTDVAAAVLYLASPAAKVVTGHVLAVDGGYLAR
jgi:NAD(P)-dependent dehydrogenase (short-subunit alcohol dehydrogenase family)